MNNDLISRSALLREARRFFDCDEKGKVVYARIKAVEVAVINAAPAMDIEAVVHAHWIHCKGKSNLWYCSACGEKIIYNPTRKTYKPHKKPVNEVNKRCRSCGAKMDGGTYNADN